VHARFLIQEPVVPQISYGTPKFHHCHTCTPLQPVQSTPHSLKNNAAAVLPSTLWTHSVRFNALTFKCLSMIRHELKGKVVPVHAMKAYGWSRGIAPLILNLGTRWRCVVNFTPRSLYPGKEPRYPLNKRQGGPQCLSGGFLDKRKTTFPYQYSNPGSSSP
jgi:hypothetical protein